MFLITSSYVIEAFWVEILIQYNVNYINLNLHLDGVNLPILNASESGKHNFWKRWRISNTV